MKINIKTLRLKNFMSIGNAWLEIDFAKKGLYRVKGINLDTNDPNGCGKSTCFIDGLMFALFGEVVRKINKPDVVNKTNGKNCKTEIIFEVNNNEYLIQRGIKPSELLIFKDGTQLLEEASVRLKQEQIDIILGSDFKTFIHLLIMSHSYSEPFCDMSTADKRKVIEDILGVGIFGKMRDYIKKDIDKDLNTNLKITLKEYEINKQTLEQLENKYKQILIKSQEFETVKNNKIETLKSELIKIKDVISKLKESLIDENTTTDKINKLKIYLKNKQNDKNNCISEIRKLELVSKENKITSDELVKNPVCPLCNTETSSGHVKEHIEKMLLSIQEDETQISVLKEKVKEINISLVTIEDKINKLEDLLLTNKRNNDKLDYAIIKRDELKQQIIDLLNTKNTFDDLLDKKQLDDRKDELEKQKLKINKLTEDKNYYEFIKSILSEEGIKNYIIKKMLPFWNAKVNYYIRQLNANFSIEFDEELNAIIMSRGIDPLTYHSFSGGEKARIDIAILMSAVDLSRVKNSLDLNVMVLDELLDGNLSSNGRELVLQILKNETVKENKAIYLISHHDNLPLDLFDSDIYLELRNGFTDIVHKKD
jgi:DNA repair exonuclease SbcCD ATPase subunit